MWWYLQVLSQCLKTIFTCKCIFIIRVSFEAILIYFKAHGRPLPWNWLLKLIFTESLFKIASKLTSIMTIHWSITLASEHNFQVLAQYLVSIITILNEYCHNTCKYWALSRWIHPNTDWKIKMCKLFPFPVFLFPDPDCCPLNFLWRENWIT